MTFDLVIGNPPYQSGAGTRTSIWHEFVLRGIGMLREGGKIAMIHPANWRGCGRTQLKRMQELRSAMRGSLDMEWLSIHGHADGMKLFGAATRFDVHVSALGSTPGFVTSIRGEDGSEYRECIKEGEFVANFKSAALEGMIAAEGEERVNLLYDPGPYHNGNRSMQGETLPPDGEFVHPCVYAILRSGELQIRHSSRIARDAGGKPVHFGVPKVIFGLWHGAGVPYVDAEGKYGMTDTAGAIADDPEVLPQIAKAMDSEGFREAMKATKFGDREWNWNVMKLFRRDFWRDFA